MEKNKNNFKKLLCYNVVNFSKCLYKNKCMFAHNLNEQRKENIREYIYEMIFNLTNLSEVDVYENKELLDELIIYTKECKNCINKKCPGGYNCKFGACTKDIKICYIDLMYGKCCNFMKEEITKNNRIIHRCLHGVHLTEKKFIPYYLRIPTDFYKEEYSSSLINYNYKNNTISLLLNDDTIKITKEILSNKLNKIDLIKSFKIKKKNILESDLINNLELIEDTKNNYDEIYRKINDFNEEYNTKLQKINDDFLDKKSKIIIENL